MAKAWGEEKLNKVIHRETAHTLKIWSNLVKYMLNNKEGDIAHARLTRGHHLLFRGRAFNDKA